MASTLTFGLTRDADRHHLTVSGEIDQLNQDEFLEHVQAAAAGTARFVLDLAGVTYCDSAAIRALLLVHRACTERGTELTVTGSRPEVRRVFSITGIDTVIHFEDADPGPG
jgi:anti-anti-sigma factor